MSKISYRFWSKLVKNWSKIGLKCKILLKKGKKIIIIFSKCSKFGFKFSAKIYLQTFMSKILNRFWSKLVKNSPKKALN